MKARQFAENDGGNVALAEFIIGVNLLGAVKQMPHLPLCQISVFPQIPDSAIHRDHLKAIISTAICGIDNYCKLQ